MPADSDPEQQGRRRIYRVAVIPLIQVRDNIYLLLLRNKARGDWEIPGRSMNQSEKPLKTATRELAEETGLELDFEIEPVPYLPGERFGQLPSQTIVGGTGIEKEVVEFTCVAKAKTPNLPSITHAPSAEHDDHLFIHLPHLETLLQRPDRLQSLLAQINTRKLVLSKTKENISVLNPSASFFSIRSRPENISLLTSSSLRRYFAGYLHG